MFSPLQKPEKRIEQFFVKGIFPQKNQICRIEIRKNVFLERKNHASL